MSQGADADRQLRSRPLVPPSISGPPRTDVVTVTLTDGTNDAAVISGTATGSVVEAGRRRQRHARARLTSNRAR